MFPIIPTDRAAAEWRNESTQKPPKQAVYMHESNAADILKNAHAQTATVWTGDFHNAKQVLAAMKKRVRRSSKKTKNASVDIQTTFHTHRMKQAQQSRVLNMLAVMYPYSSTFVTWYIDRFESVMPLTQYGRLYSRANILSMLILLIPVILIIAGPLFVLILLITDIELNKELREHFGDLDE